MPAWLYKQLDRGARVSAETLIDASGRLTRTESAANETRGIVPVLAQLCQQDPDLSKVFLCHPAVRHIFKTPREGGFCGYRNIQMLISFMQGTHFPGHEHFPGHTPSILRLQDLIENAWDQGINSSGRIETGGIKGTRKYIGTPEACKCSTLRLDNLLTLIGSSSVLRPSHWVRESCTVCGTKFLKM